MAGVALAAALSLSGLTTVAAADDPAVATVTAVYASFETALKGGGGIKDRLAAIEKTMAETFDFPAMVRVAVGPKWKSFTPEQQGALTEAFAQYFSTTYANRLAQAQGGKFTIKPASEPRGTGRSVETEVANGDGDTSQIDFLVGAGNRVQDVYLNGNVSELAAMRASFGDSLKAGGANELLKFLRERTTGMLAAKPAP
ncbi:MULTISPECIES: ABC transporter substrate-binding protein [unclassified Methylobacterium]|uniref:MlaC/ttg2D family ABC transporter substrate-binding protein n=1 Tax=unclassified Methylobacterium TaxID=2615210 RepID=UPI001FCD10A3|nr:MULTISPECIES: ABC transporter substrate-binding protein [unclassified Methylobacterium]